MAAATKARTKRAPIDEYDEATTCGPLKHPLRVRILEVCNERDVSPIQFVTEQLQPPGIRFKDQQHALTHSAYHFRELEKAGCIEIVETIPRRGATEHVYRGVAKLSFTSDEFATMPEDQRRTMTRVSAQGLIARMDGAMRAGTFDSRTDRHLVWAPIDLDERGWIEFTDALDACFAKVQRIAGDAKARLGESGGKSIPTTYGMVGFVSPPFPTPPSAES